MGEGKGRGTYGNQIFTYQSLYELLVRWYMFTSSTNYLILINIIHYLLLSANISTKLCLLLKFFMFPSITNIPHVHFIHRHHTEGLNDDTPQINTGPEIWIIKVSQGRKIWIVKVSRITGPEYFCLNGNHEFSICIFMLE